MQINHLIIIIVITNIYEGLTILFIHYVSLGVIHLLSITKT
jgi:hypothetical protein